MRQNIRRRIASDKRAKIKTGIKIKKDGREYPKSLDYFLIEPFPELVEAYGEKPTQLFVVFPSDDIEEFFQTEYNKWASKGSSHVKKRSCDGVECVHHVSEEVGGKRYVAGEISPCMCMDETMSLDEKELCNSYTGLKAYILHPKTGNIISPTCYMFETHSDNSSDNIFTELDKTWHMTGGIISKIPFILSVKMVQTTVPENGKAQKRNFPIWYLQVFGTTAQIIAYANRKSLPTTDKTRIELAEVEEKPALESPKGENETDDMTSDGNDLITSQELKSLREMLMESIKSTELGAFCNQYGAEAFSTSEITREIFRDMISDIKSGDPWKKSKLKSESQQERLPV